jgi:hypothetical protein
MEPGWAYALKEECAIAKVAGFAERFVPDTLERLTNRDLVSLGKALIRPTTQQFKPAIQTGLGIVRH